MSSGKKHVLFVFFSFLYRSSSSPITFICFRLSLALLEPVKGLARVAVTHEQAGLCVRLTCGLQELHQLAFRCCFTFTQPDQTLMPSLTVLLAMQTHMNTQIARYGVCAALFEQKTAKFHEENLAATDSLIRCKSHFHSLPKRQSLYAHLPWCPRIYEKG